MSHSEQYLVHIKYKSYNLQIFNNSLTSNSSVSIDELTPIIIETIYEQTGEVVTININDIIISGSDEVRQSIFFPIPHNSVLTIVPQKKLRNPLKEIYTNH